jgi:hypothetical protein
VDLQWAAAQPSAGGTAVAGYHIYRNDNLGQGDILLGTTSSTVFFDETVTAGTNCTYKVYAFDTMGNQSTPASAAVTVPTSPIDERRTGVRPTGAYWGAAGEQIDMLSGNLNFSIPLLRPQSRGWGVTFGLSYNSQMWRNDGGGIWKLGYDTGYGLGWRLQAGSIFPVWYNGGLLYCVFTDSTGAEYRLDQNSGGVFTSKEGVYLSYDSSAQRVYFPDGSFWVMGAQSSGAEADAGTLYPTMMQDTNGNYLS